MADDKIRKLRSQMREMLFENFEFEPVGLKELAENILRVNCRIDSRYAILNISEFIFRNSDKSITKLILTFSALRKYGYVLLKSELFRQNGWRDISLETTQYQKRIAGTEGAEEILKMFGYVNKTKDRLSFSEYIKEPIQEAVINILIDIIVAEEELDSYELSSHPYPKELETIFEVIQEQKRIVDHDISKRSSTITGLNDAKIQNKMNLQGEHQALFQKQYSVESLDLSPCSLCGVSKGLIECVDCKCSHCVECDEKWHMHPKRLSHTNRITKEKRREGDHRRIGTRSELGVNQTVGLLRQSDAIDVNNSRVQPYYTFVHNESTESDTKRQAGEMYVTESRQSYKVPKVDSYAVDVEIQGNLSKERKNLEIRLELITKSLQSLDKTSLKHQHLVAEQGNLRQHWKEIEMQLRKVTVTEQPRAIVKGLSHNDVPVRSMEHEGSQSFKFHSVEKNIRRPPTDDINHGLKCSPNQFCEIHYEMGHCFKCYTSKQDTPTNDVGQHIYTDFRNKDNSIEFNESHFSISVGWGCPHCTFLNKDNDRLICEMCSKTTSMQDRESLI